MKNSITISANQFQIGVKLKLKDGDEYLIKKSGIRGSGERMKDDEFYLVPTKGSSMAFDASIEWLLQNVAKIGD
jgi:hypothetical protein